MEHLITILVNSRNRGSRTLDCKGYSVALLDADAIVEENLKWSIENLWASIWCLCRMNQV